VTIWTQAASSGTAGVTSPPSIPPNRSFIYTSAYLSGTPVTDAGLKEVAALPRLTLLSLYDTKVTDAGMTQVAALRELRSLDLGMTAVTDAGLQELAALPKLERLTAGGSKVTRRGVRALEKALPGCYIPTGW
jgi:hypothetical protein